MNARPADSGVHFVWLTVFGSTCAPNTSIKILAFSGGVSATNINKNSNVHASVCELNEKYYVLECLCVKWKFL